MIKNNLRLLLAGIALQLSACAQNNNFTHSKTFKQMNQAKESNERAHVDTATFGAGCFWCTEAQFLQLKGVLSVQSGYCGGHTANPTYHDVCTGTTGHAEVCNIYYDPSVISFDQLLMAFWTCHDPTTLNRQGNDVGTQYRSAVFYHNAMQKETTLKYISQLNAEKAFNSAVVTSVEPFTTFYIAEDYHQDYYAQNGTQPYCRFVIQPKLEKFKKVFKDNLKDSH